MAIKPPAPQNSVSSRGPIVLGIDLGLTNARVAYLGPAGPVLLRNDRSDFATPTVVAIDRSGQLHIGEAARAQGHFIPERAAAGVKRLMGTRETIILAERRYSPVEVSATILRRLREDAERLLGSSVVAAAIAVPAYFTDAQRQATRDAATLANLGQIALCSEPMAIALAYDAWDLPRGQRALIFDLGGVSLDVSIIEGGTEGPRLIAAAGQGKIGGEDIDKRLVSYLLDLFARSHGFSVADDPHSLARLRLAAEKAKRDLSERESLTISIASLGLPGTTPVTLETELSREQLELLCEDTLHKTLEQVDIALRDARLTQADISAVLLSGGGAQVPMVRRLLGERLGRPPREGVAPAEAVVRGVTLYAGRLGLMRDARGRGPSSGEPAAPQSAAPYPPLPPALPPRRPVDSRELDGAQRSAAPSFEGSPRRPVESREAEDPRSAAQRGQAEPEGFNDLALATQERRQQRAARTAALSAPATCPVTLGIEVVGQSGSRRMAGVFSAMLKRGEMAPVVRTVVFHTTVPNQREIEVRIFEGEGPLVRDCTALEVLTVGNIPAGAAGAEKIAVTFQCDERGALSVRARVLSNGVEETLHLARVAPPPPPPHPRRPAAAVELAGSYAGQLHPDDRPRRVSGRDAVRRDPSAEFSLEEVRVLRDEVGPEMDSAALRRLLQDAERRVVGAHPQVRVKLQYLMRRLREAVVVGDRADVVRLSEALQGALLALE